MDHILSEEDYKKLNEELLKLTPEKRAEIINIITDGICQFCGNDAPCYCMVW